MQKQTPQMETESKKESKWTIHFAWFALMINEFADLQSTVTKNQNKTYIMISSIKTYDLSENLWQNTMENGCHNKPQERIAEGRVVWWETQLSCSAIENDS